MRIFDIFKKKSDSRAPEKKLEKSDAFSIMNFDPYYLYGLSNYHPFIQSTDNQSFNILYDKVIGQRGGMIIGSAFHPYQLVNQKGTTVWHAAYAQVYTHKDRAIAFDAIINEKARFLVDPSSSFQQIFVWPDTRLTTDKNPIFGKYIPFVIPFFVYKESTELRWDVELKKELIKGGRATNLANYITDSARFLMREPSFILGFDEFKEDNPSALIDNFIAVKPMIET